MTIAPIVRSVEVKAPPARAFDLFAGHIGAWWPKGMTIGKAHHASITIESRAGGRVYETDEEGHETPWGKVLAWEPPGRLLLSWEINAKWAPDPSVATEVELTFAPSAAGTLVTLEHRNLERLGADAEAYAGQVGGGWPGLLGRLATYAETHE